MALTNVERQMKWREKNRALYNLRRRAARKKALSGGVEQEHVPASSRTDQLPASTAQPLRDEDVGAMNCVECGGYEEHRDGCSSTISVESPKRSKIEELRELIKVEHEKIVEEPVKPLIFRNDYGAIISERAWNQLQEKKRKAKEGGYELDDYSQ